MWAVGLCSLLVTTDLPRDQTDVPPPRVLGRLNGFQVVGVDASRDAAEMVDVQAVGDGADHEFVGHPVGTLQPSIEPESAITGLARRRGP